MCVFSMCAPRACSDDSSIITTRPARAKNALEIVYLVRFFHRLSGVELLFPARSLLGFPYPDTRRTPARVHGIGHSILCSCSAHEYGSALARPVTVRFVGAVPSTIAACSRRCSRASGCGKSRRWEKPLIRPSTKQCSRSRTRHRRPARSSNGRRLHDPQSPPTAHPRHRRPTTTERVAFGCLSLATGGGRDIADKAGFAANAVRLQLHALAYNLANFLRTLALPPTPRPSRISIGHFPFRVAQLRDAKGRARTRARCYRKLGTPVGCGAFRLDFEEGLGGEAEGTALFLPVLRQVFAHPQEPHRR
jgi:hypothetical protein